MDCPSCGKDNREGARFCRYCASTFALRCTVCDAELVPDSVFCDVCASPVAEQAAPERSAAARKVVTVLFADLVGSTALEERMDAESVRAILDRFYAAMRAEVERYAGRVVKFTGDGLMAAFGVPDVREDDAVRAVDAALAMRTELEELASDLGLDLSLKVGVNTGEVVVAGADDDVVGDAVNVASRLEGAATSGEILVGEETWRLTRGTSRYEPIAPLVLKGKSEPVPAYRLLSVDERTADSAAAPFVGRDAELGKLLAVFQDAVEANAARLVTIIGSPGLGKTRLARELMDELADQARVRETRCDPAGAQTFAPIADTLRAAAGISETDTEDEVIAKLAARLPDDEPDRDRIAMRAAAILGVGLAGTTEETFWAIRRLIEAAASVQPVVLVLDDLHWAEPLLLDLVEHLAEWITDAPVLLVGTARPELRDMRPSLAEGGRAASVIALEGLDQDATAQLALNLLETDELPAALLTKIPASTEGNPLFVRELVRMLVDDGVLLRTQDGWSVTVDVDAIQVPPTIQSLLSARVDRLRNDERTVLELASVVGKEFYRGALHDLAPPGVRDVVDGCLESLRRKELVEPVGTYWIDEPVYRFHHVLIRDAVYRRLLKESRAELHERVAEWLERKTADVLGEHGELVGYHVEQAHEHKRQLGRTDDALGRRAAELLGAAAKRALDRDDLPVAATLSGRALERLPAGDDDERSELLLIHCEALLSMRDIAQGSVAAAEFERLANTPRLQAWATCFSGHLAILTSPERLEETEALVAAAADELSALGDQAGAAKAHTVHASALGSRGRFADSESVLDAALSAARKADDRRRITATLGMAPHAALWGPSPVSRAGGRCLDIVRLLRITTGSPAVEATSLRCQAVLESFRGRADAARRMLRSARRTLIDLGLQREVLETDQFAGIVEIVAGDPAAAMPHLRTSYEGCRAYGIDILAGQSAALLARAHLALGDVDEAESLVVVAEELGGKNLKAAIDAAAVKAELLARRGAFEEARAIAESAVALAEETDALFDVGNAYRSLARVLHAAGDTVGAEGAEEHARAAFELKGATALVETTSRDAEVVRDVDARSLENTCTRQTAAWREAFHTGDWDALARLVADDMVFADRRPMFRDTRIGRGTYVELLKMIHSNTRIEPFVLAVRGDRLCLEQVLFRTQRGDESFDNVTICLSEIDSREQRCAEVHFEPDDLDAAFEELDRRYVAGEGAICAAPLARFNDLMRELNERNWAAVEAIFLPDAIVDDRTPASRGAMSVDRFLTSFKELVELTTSLCVRAVAIHAVSQDVTVAEAHNRGVSVDGVEVDLAYQVLVVHREGHVARLELFPVDRLDLARQRFDELTAAVRPAARVENRCARVNAAYNDAFNRRDFEGLRSIVSENVRLEDRRTGMRSSVEGRDGVIANLRTVADLGPIIASADVIATRGERLALVLDRWASSDPSYSFTAELLSVVQIDEDDRFEWAVTFDSDDLADALNELDERYIVQEGSADPELVRLLGEFGRAYTARDLDRLRALFTEDFTVSDHRLASTGDLDREGLLRYLGAAYELTEEAEAYAVAILAIAPGQMLVRFEVHGTTNEDALYETAIHFIIERRADRIARAEQFAFDQLDLAFRRFDELGVERHRELDNRSMAVLRQVVSCIERGEWDTLVRLYRDATVVEDRRRGLRNSVTGPQAIIELAKSQRDAFATHHYACIATRGERLALARGTWSTSEAGDSFDAEVLRLGEIDDEGRVVATILFDHEDIDEAFAELDERYASGEGAHGARVIGIYGDFNRTYNARDWDALRTLATDDFTLVDHRLASLGTIGPDEYVRAMRTLVELIPGRMGRVLAVPALSERACVGCWESSGHTADGAAIDETFYIVFLLRGDRVVRHEIFPDSRLDDALQRFEELDRGAEAPSDLENAASACVRRINESATAADRGGLMAAFAADAVLDDRRSGLSFTQIGREPIVDHFMVAITPGSTYTAETEATRGDRLSLTRHEVRLPNDFCVEYLQVTESDEEGHALVRVVFDADDLDAAFDELDRRYASGEGIIGSEFVDVGSRLPRAINSSDWEAARALLSDDFVGIDHRPASLGELHDPDAWIASIRTLAELAASYRMQVAAYLRLDESGVVADMRNVVTSREGGTFENASYVVARVASAHLAYIEIYPANRRDAAIAKFDELRATDVSGASLENAATRNAIAGGDAMRREEWEAFRTLYTPDVVIVDRRRGIGSRGVGVDSFITNFKTVLDLGFEAGDQQILAIRGDHLALVAGTMTDPVGNVLDGIVLFETDAEGRSRYIAYFDMDDPDAAFEELDAKFAASLDAARAGIARSSIAINSAYNSRDWTRFASLIAADLVFVDHIPAAVGPIDGRDAYVHYVRSMTELVPDARREMVRDVVLSADGGVGQSRLRGASADGVEIEIVWLDVAMFHGGVLVRLEQFPVEQLDAAVARFDELGRTRDGPHTALENACTRNWDRLSECYVERDWTGYVGLLSDDIAFEDRRTGLGVRAHGPEVFIEQVKVIAEMGAAQTTDVVATRGTSAALLRIGWYDPRGGTGSPAVPTFHVHEVDDEERLVTLIVFDEDDLDAAFDELDERYIAGEGAPFATILRKSSELTAVHRNEDWDRWRSSFAEDIEVIDHRPASWGTIRGIDAWVEHSRAVVDVMSHVRVRHVAIHAIAEDRVLRQLMMTGTNAEGGPIELRHLVVACHAAGKVVRMEVFPLERLDDALARFAELRAPRTQTALGLPETMALRVQRRRNEELWPSGDWDAYAATLTEDAVYEDRRRGLRHRDEGRDAVIEHLRLATEGTKLRWVPVASRGERLVLVHYVASMREGFEVELLGLHECDEQGLWTLLVHFDVDDLDAAFDELDERYIAGDGAAYADAIRAEGTLCRTLNDRDWGALDALLAGDFVLVDHRPASLGTIDAQGWVAAQKAKIELVPTYRGDPIYYHGLAPNAWWVQIHARATTDYGTDVDFSVQSVGQVRDGRIVRLDTFLDSQTDDALALFESLTQPKPVTHTNTATRTVERFSEAFAQRDWAVLADLLHDDAVRDDRRRGLGAVVGKVAMVDAWKVMAELGFERFDYDALATRGDHLFLIRASAIGSHGFETEGLVVHETDGAGRIVRSVIFDPDDLDSAFDELDERFLASDEVPESYHWQLESGRAYNARDWDRYRAMLADDFVFADYRTVSAGTIAGADEAVVHRKTLIDLVPDARVQVRRAIRATSNVGLLWLWIYGTDEHGSRVEYEHYVIPVLENGLSTRSEVFPVTDLDAAIARFDELVAEQARPRLAIENDATRATKRFMQAFIRRDWDALAVILHDDLVRDDRRQGLRGLAGKADVIDGWKVNADLGYERFTFETVATRGERLCLVHGLGTGSHGFEVEALTIRETDGAGRVVRSVFFDPDELDAAFAELDERYAAGEGAEYQAIFRLTTDFVDAYNARDWERVAGLVPAEHVMIDHRPASAGEIVGGRAAADYVAALAELLPDASIRVIAIPRIAPDRGLAHFMIRGTSTDGGSFEFPWLHVSKLRDGVLERSEIFAPERLDDALARFDELASP